MAYLVQHGEKERGPGDPGLAQAGRRQATRTGQWLRGLEVRALYSSPMRRAQETAECIASVTGLAVQTDARSVSHLPQAAPRNWLPLRHGA